MKRMTFPLVLAVAAFATSGTALADETPTPVRGPTAVFTDADGDGINDNAPDHDGDGVVNHLDPDHSPLGDGRGHGAGGMFRDENGDGIHDLAADDDGDGVPNGQDEDYALLGHGRRGRMMQAGAGEFVDADGDGINDNAPDDDGDGIVNHLDPDHEGPSGAAAPATNGRSGRGMGRSGMGRAGQ